MFRNCDSSYRLLLTIGEILGLISVILVGLFFPNNGFYASYNWNKNPFSYHPLMMTVGLLFCYGNAILVYRTFKQASKFHVKLLHTGLLILSLLFTVVGLTAIIRSKNLGNRPHLMTYHSWIGLITIILFILQWICGFVSFLIPKLSLEFRQRYLPSHRLWGKIIFLSAMVTILTGLSEHGMGTSFFTTDDKERSRRLIINFFGIFASLFYLIVIYLLSNPDYQRPNSTQFLESSAYRMKT